MKYSKNHIAFPFRDSIGSSYSDPVQVILGDLGVTINLLIFTIIELVYLSLKIEYLENK